MDNLWILTEERPKTSVLMQIVSIYCDDFNDIYENDDSILIKPIIKNDKFTFTYEVEGFRIKKANKIFIKTVSGNSSFIDFLVFKQENEPTEGSTSDNLIMAVEETKTSDDESRNTGVYQRGSKFVFINAYYKNVKLYMLYNDELQERENKVPSETSIFGTSILLTLGVKIIGKNDTSYFKPYKALDDLINAKNSMRMPPAGNVPIRINKYANKIEISGRLSKPAEAGNIGHDPNIGALSMISACMRALGWTKEIIITNHGVSQEYINKTNGDNKFLYNCKIINLKLDNITMPENVSLPENYWHYEMSSEKMTTILLHIIALYSKFHTVYENHAGCERGYFKTLNNEQIVLPKKDKNEINLYLPDVVLYDKESNTTYIIEGKKLSTLENGIEEIELYDSIENDYIKKYYPTTEIKRYVSIFGGNENKIQDDKILIYMNTSGEIYINDNAPEGIKNIFRKFISNL